MKKDTILIKLGIDELVRHDLTTIKVGSDDVIGNKDYTWHGSTKLDVILG